MLQDLLPGASGSGSAGILQYLSVSNITAGGQLSGANLASGLASGAVTDSNGDTFADLLTFTLGDVTNTAGVAGGAGSQIGFDITARVKDVAANYAGLGEFNTASWSILDPNNPGGRTGGNATADVTIVEPHLVLSKGVSDPAATAGQTVTYTITLANQVTGAGDGPAFNATIQDLLTQLPPNVVFNPGSLMVTGGTGATVAPFMTGLRATATELDVGQSLTVTFTAMVQNGAVAGDVVHNTATSTATSIPAGPDNRNYSNTADAQVQLITPTSHKSLTDTSDHTNGASLAVGEIGTYRIVVDVPGGTNNAFTINDLLPDSSAGRLTYVAGSVSVISTGSTGATGSPTITLSDSNANGTADKLALGFGSIVAPVHSPGDPAYQITIQFQAQLTDVPANQPGATLTNNAFATVVDSNGVTQTGNIAMAQVATVQPLLDISKSTPFTTGDAGDIVTYTVTIQHDAMSSSTAYNLNIADTLPSSVGLIAGSVSTSFGSVAAAGNTITVTSPGPYLLGAAPITITYQARLLDTVFNGQSITNVSNLTYSTEPVAGRPLSGHDDAMVGVVLTDTLAKTLFATSLPATTGTDLAPGETATYRITATLGEGSQLLTLADALPAGMTLVSAQVISIGANISNSAGLVAGSGANSGTGFDFGTVVNHGDNLTNAGDRIVVEYVTRVAAGVAGGTNLTDTATLTASTPGGTPMPMLTSPVTDHVVAPVLDIAKSTPFTTGDAGDVATYTITISHDALSTAAAYNLALGDLVPAGLILVGTATTTAGTLTTPGGNSLALSLAQYDLGAAPITITYQAKLADNVINGQHITNTANLTYSSAPTNGTPGSASASAAEDVVITDSLVKAITGTSYAITTGNIVGLGEVITYTLTATLHEGAQSLVLADAMPTGLNYLSSSVLSLGHVSGSALAVGAAGSFAAGSNTVSFDFGNIINPGDNLSDAGDTITVQVVAQVAPGNAVGTGLTNTGTLTPGLPTNTPFTGTPAAPSTSTQTVAVIATSNISGTVGLDAPFFCCGTQATAVFQGITVNLLGSMGQVLESTTTDALGHYTLTGIVNGSYTTQFVAPSGLVFAPIGSPGLQGVVDTANAAGLTGPIVINGADVGGVDAGLLYAPTVGLTGNAPTTLPNGGGTYNFDGNGVYAIGGTGGGYTLNGNGGLPYLVGGTGNNILHGGNGQGSILVGGPGQNIFEGTPGADIILFCCGGGNGQGLGSNGQGLGTNGSGLFNGNACFNFDLMVGGRDADTIEGNDGLVTALGGDGNDTIHARGLIVGGGNTGTISYAGGQFGNYTVGDTIKIGNGKTDVVYQVGDGVQYIENFQPGRGDVIDVYGYGAPVATGLVNGMGVLYFANNAALIINGWQPQNGPLTGIVYHPAETSMPGAFGHFMPLPPVVLPTSQTSFYGTQGDDIAIGSATGTTFHGNGGNDLLVGGNGNNVFYGDAGNNSLYGGSGTDIFYLNAGSNFVEGCGGNDVAVFSTTQAQASVVHNADGTTTVTTPTGTTILTDVETLRFTDATVSLTGAPPPAILAGTAGADTFVVNAASSIILDQVNGDNDQAFVSVNGWTVSPNVEIARLSGNATMVTANDTGVQLVANPVLASTLVGGAGNDVFWGGLGADIMIGGAGDDIFRPGGGAADMTGGAGNDQYVIGNAAQQVHELPGGGIDTAWVTVNGWTVADNVEIVRLVAPGLSVTLGTSGAQVVAAASGSTITAAAGDNVFWSSNGTDVFVGGSGNDIFYGGTGTGSFTGGAGNDAFVVKSLNTTLIENPNGGYDTAWVTVSNFVLPDNIEEGRLAGTANFITGSATANQLVANPTVGSTLVAGGGTSALWGSSFADTFVASAASQNMYLYGGADVVKFTSPVWGIDQIADFSGGWGDGDMLNFQGSGLLYGDLTITDFGSKTLIQHGADQIILYGVGNLSHVLGVGDLVF